MSALVRLTSAASADMVSAREWYEQKQVGLGAAFVRAVDGVLDGVGRRPDLFPPAHRGLRRVLTRRFPYAVYYRIDADAVRVVAILHSAMDLRRLDEHL